MSRITLDIPGDALAALKPPANEASDAVRLAAAAKLYETGRLSTGAAARLAGVPRPVFLTKLADYGVDTFVLNREDLEDETRFA